MIKINSISKNINNIKVLSNITLHCSNNDIYALLGPNGVGKTSLLRCIIGMYTFKNGTIQIDGKSLQGNEEEILNTLGIHTDESKLFPDLSLKENFLFYQKFYKTPYRWDEISCIAENIGLHEVLHKQVKTLSTGNKKKGGLLRSIIGKPKLLIWDEPFSGLDPEGVRAIKDLMLNQKRDGKTVFFCSHDLQYCEQICNKLSFMFLGRPVLEYNIIDLKSMYSNLSLEEIYFAIKERQSEDKFHTY